MELLAVVVDTETTGFTKPEVIEMAWVELAERTFERIDHIKCEKYKPEGPIELRSLPSLHPR